MCGCWSNEAVRSVSYFGPSDERGCGCNCKRGEQLGQDEIQVHSLRARGYDPMAPPCRDQFEPRGASCESRWGARYEDGRADPIRKRSLTLGFLIAGVRRLSEAEFDEVSLGARCLHMCGSRT
jgi:hypothetical protein